MPSLDVDYWKRQPVLLEACELLRKEVTDSLADLLDCTCDFRVIELGDLSSLPEAQVGSRLNVWRDSAALIQGTVTAPNAGRLSATRNVTANLFTTHEDQDSQIIVVVPPWAKPAAWHGPLDLPLYLTIHFRVHPTAARAEQGETVSFFQPLTLALSGGGVRAAVFQLGILVLLAQQNRLKDVREMVSVSGGSILAAHFLKHWPEATSELSEFRKVAARLLGICRSDIRNRIFVPWLWSWLLPWSYFFHHSSRSGRLLGEYQRIFNATTLGDLEEGRPKMAFVATDGIQHHRVAFTSSQILRWSFDEDDDAPPAPILSNGVELSLAVAASSCFPPVFPRLHLNYQDLGITFREFKQVLDLNDGGVVANLGIEVLIALRKLGWTDGKLVLIADAERSLPVKPGGSALADVDATLAALGKAAREDAKREFGSSAIPIPFADRVEGNDGLPFRTETAMFNYRTDLDAPSWPEIHGLMVHGAFVARQATKHCFNSVDKDALKATIASIIEEAGGPARSSLPAEVDYRGCGNRSYLRLCVHGFLIFLLVATLGFVTYNVVRWARSELQDAKPLNDELVPDAAQLPSRQPRTDEADRGAVGTQRDEQVNDVPPGELPLEYSEVVGKWRSSNDSGESVRLEPPKEEVVIAASSKSFAVGRAEARLAKGGPSGTFVWVHLHGVHPDRFGSTVFQLAVLVRDEGGYYYLAVPNLESKVEGVFDKASRHRHSYGQFHLPKGDAAESLLAAVESKAKLVVEICGTRDNEGIFADIPSSARKLVEAYLKGTISQLDMLSQLNEGKARR